MAELVSSALLSAFFSVLFDKLATEEVKNFLRPKKVIKTLLEKLKRLRLSADELLDDAEEKLIYNPRVEDWHNDLKDVVYKASELADKIETEALRRQYASNMTKMFKKLCSNPLNSFDNYVKKELEEIISSLEELLSQKDALGLVPAGRSNCSGVRTRVSERPRPTPVADESTFCGREDLKKTIFQSLRSADVGGKKMGVIPIIGAGGLGKTTLAQIIYNHPDVKKHFPVRAWVIVSTKFDLPVITKEIMEKVSGSSQIDEHDAELPFKLKDALKGQKFLLVLDDVWSEDRHKWFTFESYFQSAENGSKIIVTTRSKEVASVVAPNQPHHELPVLPEEDCLKLFDQTVFCDVQDQDAHRHLQEIGKKIVKKCKGNPLSVVCVGGILRSERGPEKWEKVFESSVWESLQENCKSIIPSLWLSYRYLPSHLKRCFAYCSIFPKDYLFRKEQMVQLWMAEGFLKNEARSTIEEVGKQYFEDLISRSLFQRSSDDAETVTMHDLVHDLAMYVSGKFCFWLDKDKSLCDLACETRHLSYNLAIGDAEKFEGLSKAKRLHSFVGLEPSVYRYCKGAKNFNVLKVLEEFSMEGACLRVLCLSSHYYKIDSLPESVGKLKHLRYLNLSEASVTKLPDSICTLYNLQTLLLSGCRNLTRLPDSVGKLKHLRYLNLSRSSVTKLPDSICTLYNLQTLLLSTCWRLTRLPSNLGSLINLHHLDTSDSPLEEMPPKMCNLKKLHTLTDFVLGKQSGSSIKDLGVLQDLHGRIRISGLQNVTNVDDPLEAILKNKKNLSEVALEWEGRSRERDSGHEEKVLEALQPHANLKKLFISQYGGTRFPNWAGDSVFRLLEVLHLEDMPEWNCWSFIQDDRDSVFPSLKEFQLKDCPKLVGGLPNFNAITTLRIENCKNFEFPWNSHYGSLEKLEILNCEALKSIALDYFPKLNWFRLWKCQNFESFRFGEEPPLVLEFLCLRDLPKFVSFPEGGLHAPNLKHFFIDKCENLRSLPQQMHMLLPSLNDLVVANCGEIESWPEGGLPSNLESLEIRGCKKLVAQVKHWDLQTLTPCLKSFSIYGCGEELLDSFPPEGLLPTSLTSLSIRDFRGLKTLNIHAFQHLEYLYLYDCGELQFLTEESLPKSLSLYIFACPLLERRYQKETGEGWDKISHIPIVYINGREQHES